MFCEKCKKMFKTVEELQKHISIKHESVLYICAYCDEQYTNMNDLRDHAYCMHGMKDSKDAERL